MIKRDYFVNNIPPVLMYHIIDPKLKCSISISPQIFEFQIKALHNNGFKGATIDEFFKATIDQSLSNEKLVLITFDDGYEESLRIAMPVLEKYRFSAIAFVNTDSIGMYNDWNTKAKYRLLHSNWDCLQEWIQRGFEIGSHGCSHQSILKLEYRIMEYEMKHSKNLLEEKLKEQITAFSYPYGDYNKLSTKLASESYKMAFTSEISLDLALPILYRLPRIGLNNFHSPKIFDSALEINLWSLGEFTRT